MKLFKTMSCLLFCAALGLSGCKTTETSNTATMQQPAPADNTHAYRRGVNISHYLSQLGHRKFADPHQFDEEDMAWIASKGYDHIRLPLDGPLLFDEKGNINWEPMLAVDRVLEWAKPHNINVILDIHELPGSNFTGNPDTRLFTDMTLQDRALSLWKGISERYKEVGPELRFEILNEPVSPDPVLLTKFYRRALDVVHAVSPERVVLLCSNRWGSFRTVRHLEPLLGEPNLVIAVHYYQPHIFTHQKASWVGSNHPDFPDISFPGVVPDLTDYVAKDHYGRRAIGTELTVAAVEEDFAKLVAWTKRHGAVVHVGEFGVYDKVIPQSRTNWYNTVLGECEKYGIGWAVWDYMGSFAVRDQETGKPTIVQEAIQPHLD